MHSGSTTSVLRTTPAPTPDARPRPLWFRIEFQWQGSLLDSVGLHLMQCLLNAFEPGTKILATNDDFTATFGAEWPGGLSQERRVEVLRQLLQCLGILRAFRSRWEVYGPDDTTDDVAERLHKNPSWTYYGPPG